MWRRRAAVKNASTDWGWMVGKTEAVVVPLRRSSSKKNSAWPPHGGIGEPPFRRKRISLQPLEQLRAVGGDDVDLRIVDMGIDEARQDQLTAIVVDRGAGEVRRREVGAIRLPAPRSHPRSPTRRRASTPRPIFPALGSIPGNAGSSRGRHVSCSADPSEDELRQVGILGQFPHPARAPSRRRWSTGAAGLVGGSEADLLEQPFQHRLQAPRADVLDAAVDRLGQVGDRLDGVVGEIEGRRPRSPAAPCTA